MKLTKYPRTFHLPFSLAVSSDDKLLQSLDSFVGNRVIVTEKMDGENTSLYSDGTTHARSIDRSHLTGSGVSPLPLGGGYKPCL
jgi:hypothetical protein